MYLVGPVLENEEGKDFLEQLSKKLEGQEAFSIKLILHYRKFLLQRNYFKLSVQLNVVDSFLTYVQLFNKNIRLAPNDIWNSELKQMKEKFIHKYQNFYENIGEKGKRLTVALKKELEKELLNLPKMLTDVPEEEQLPDQLESLISQLREDVKRGDRVTFKVLQELQHRLENMDYGAQSELEQLVENTKEEAKKNVRQLVKLLVEIFDLLDLIHTNAIQKEDEVWTNEVTNVVEKGLMLLSDYGIEEIPVFGQPFDGNIMEGIGTVSEKEAEGLNKYDVHSVFQRGFRFKHNKELIRRAKVITVY